MKPTRYFEIARKVAVRGDAKDARRRHRLGAVGLRSDGVLVCASNICTRTPRPEAHAERRVTNMLTPNSYVFVVRIGADGGLRNAKPCQSCVLYMTAKGVRRCYYTISEYEWGVVDL